jgi:hypothetical protein
MTIAVEPLKKKNADYIRIVPLRYIQNLKGILEDLNGKNPLAGICRGIKSQ